MVAILLALVIPPFVVHWMFKTPARNSFFEQTWGAGDLITYIAGLEAFIGTVFLGVVALRQNDKANELNERMLINEEKHQKYERQPCIQLVPKDISTQTIHDIFNFNGPVYFYKDVADLKGYPPKYWEKEFVFFSWDINNVISKQIKVAFKTLEVDSLDKHDKLLFVDHRINLYPPIPIIVPQKSIGFGFIIEAKKLRSRKMRMGELVLNIYNEINENYIYTLGFSISSNSETGFFLYNLYDKIDPVN